MMHLKVSFVVLALCAAFIQAKPSHPFVFPGVFDHLDLAPPVLPPAQFHAGEPAAFVPYHHHHHHAKLLPSAHFHANPLLAAPEHWLPAPAPLLPAAAPFLPPAGHLLHAPTPLLPVPAPILPAPAPLVPAATPLLPAPAPLLPAPIIHAQTQVLSAPAPIATPLLETLPIVEPIPSYRAIPGPKTTTHHVSVGYAFPQPRFAKLHAHLHSVPHAHLHAAPLALPHHHHHTLF